MIRMRLAQTRSTADAQPRLQQSVVAHLYVVVRDRVSRDFYSGPPGLGRSLPESFERLRVRRQLFVENLVKESGLAVVVDVFAPRFPRDLLH